MDGVAKSKRADPVSIQGVGYTADAFFLYEQKII